MDAVIVSGATIKPSQVVRDLGVVVDGDLSLAAHVSHVTSVCFFHLRQLRLIRRSLTLDTAPCVHTQQAGLLQRPVRWLRSQSADAVDSLF